MTEPQPPSRLRNLSYASIAGLAGCWITLVVLVALFAGLWLDARLGLRGPFTVGLVIVSVPVSLYIAVRVVLGLLARIQSPDDRSTNKGGFFEE